MAHSDGTDQEGALTVQNNTKDMETDMVQNNKDNKKHNNNNSTIAEYPIIVIELDMEMELAVGMKMKTSTNVIVWQAHHNRHKKQLIHSQWGLIK